MNMKKLIKKIRSCVLPEEQLLPLLDAYLSTKSKKCEITWDEVVKRLLNKSADDNSEVLFENTSTIIKFHLNKLVWSGLKDKKQLSKKYSNIISSLLTHLHLTMEDTNLHLGGIQTLTCLILAALIDVTVAAHKKEKETEVVNEIFMKLILIFGHCEEYQLDTLFHCRSLILQKFRHPSIHVSLIKRLFSSVKSGQAMSPVLYMKYLLLGKLLLFMTEKERGKTRTYLAKLFKVPERLTEWAEEENVTWLCPPKWNTRLILKNMTLLGTLQTFYGVEYNQFLTNQDCKGKGKKSSTSSRAKTDLSTSPTSKKGDGKKKRKRYSTIISETDSDVDGKKEVQIVSIEESDSEGKALSPNTKKSSNEMQRKKRNEESTVQKKKKRKLQNNVVHEEESPPIPESVNSIKMEEQTEETFYDISEKYPKVEDEESNKEENQNYSIRDEETPPVCSKSIPGNKHKKGKEKRKLSQTSVKETKKRKVEEAEEEEEIIAPTTTTKEKRKQNERKDIKNRDNKSKDSQNIDIAIHNTEGEKEEETSTPTTSMKEKKKRKEKKCKVTNYSDIENSQNSDMAAQNSKEEQETITPTISMKEKKKYKEKKGIKNINDKDEESHNTDIAITNVKEKIIESSKNTKDKKKLSPGEKKIKKTIKSEKENSHYTDVNTEEEKETIIPTRNIKEKKKLQSCEKKSNESTEVEIEYSHNTDNAIQNIEEEEEIIVPSRSRKEKKKRKASKERSKINITPERENSCNTNTAIHDTIGEEEESIIPLTNMKEKKKHKTYENIYKKTTNTGTENSYNTDLIVQDAEEQDEIVINTKSLEEKAKPKKRKRKTRSSKNKNSLNTDVADHHSSATPEPCEPTAEDLDETSVIGHSIEERLLDNVGKSEKRSRKRLSSHLMKESCNIKGSGSSHDEELSEYPDAVLLEELQGKSNVKEEKLKLISRKQKKAMRRQKVRRRSMTFTVTDLEPENINLDALNSEDVENRNRKVMNMSDDDGMSTSIVAKHPGLYSLRDTRHGGVDSEDSSGYDRSDDDNEDTLGTPTNEPELEKDTDYQIEEETLSDVEICDKCHCNIDPQQDSSLSDLEISEECDTKPIKPDCYEEENQNIKHVFEFSEEDGSNEEVKEENIKLCLSSSEENINDIGNTYLSDEDKQNSVTVALNDNEENNGDVFYSSPKVLMRKISKERSNDDDDYYKVNESSKLWEEGEGNANVHVEEKDSEVIITKCTSAGKEGKTSKVKLTRSFNGVDNHDENVITITDETEITKSNANTIKSSKTPNSVHDITPTQSEDESKVTVEKITSKTNKISPYTNYDNECSIVAMPGSKEDVVLRENLNNNYKEVNQSVIVLDDSPVIQMKPSVKVEVKQENEMKTSPPDVNDTLRTLPMFGLHTEQKKVLPRDPVSRMMNNFYKSNVVNIEDSNHFETVNIEVKKSPSSVINDDDDDDDDDKSVVIVDEREDIECVLQNIVKDTGRLTSIIGIRERLLSESSIKDEQNKDIHHKEANCNGAPAENTKNSTNNIEAPTEIIEIPAENTETPTEIIETSFGNTETPTEIIETSFGSTETPTEIIETPTENTETPTEIIETSFGNTETPTEIIETSFGNTETPIEIIETSFGNTETPTEIIETPTGNTETPTEIIETPTENIEDSTENIKDTPIENKAPTEHLEVPIKNIKASTEKDETTAENIQASTENINDLTENNEASTQHTQPSTENTEAPTESIKAPTENIEPLTEDIEPPTENIATSSKKTDALTDNIEAPRENIATPTDNTEASKLNIQSPTENILSPTENHATSTENLKSPTDITKAASCDNQVNHVSLQPPSDVNRRLTVSVENDYENLSEGIMKDPSRLADIREPRTLQTCKYEDNEIPEDCETSPCDAKLMNTNEEFQNQKREVLSNTLVRTTFSSPQKAAEITNQKSTSGNETMISAVEELDMHLRSLNGKTDSDIPKKHNLDSVCNNGTTSGVCTKGKEQESTNCNILQEKKKFSDSQSNEMGEINTDNGSEENHLDSTSGKEVVERVSTKLTSEESMERNEAETSKIGNITTDIGGSKENTSCSVRGIEKKEQETSKLIGKESAGINEDEELYDQNALKDNPFSLALELSSTEMEESRDRSTEGGDEAYEASSDASEDPAPRTRRRSRSLRKTLGHQNTQKTSDSDSSPVRAVCARASGGDASLHLRSKRKRSQSCSLDSNSSTFLSHSGRQTLDDSINKTFIIEKQYLLNRTYIQGESVSVADFSVTPRGENCSSSVPNLSVVDDEGREKIVNMEESNEPITSKDNEISVNKDKSLSKADLLCDGLRNGCQTTNLPASTVKIDTMESSTSASSESLPNKELGNKSTIVKESITPSKTTMTKNINETSSLSKIEVDLHQGSEIASMNGVPSIIVKDVSLASPKSCKEEETPSINLPKLKTENLLKSQGCEMIIKSSPSPKSPKRKETHPSELTNLQEERIRIFQDSELLSNNTTLSPEEENKKSSRNHLENRESHSKTLTVEEQDIDDNAKTFQNFENIETDDGKIHHSESLIDNDFNQEINGEDFFEGGEVEILSTSGIDEDDERESVGEALDDTEVEPRRGELVISKKSLRSHIRKLYLTKDSKDVSSDLGVREGRLGQLSLVKAQCLSEAALTKEVLISPDVSDEECELVSPGIGVSDVKFPIAMDNLEENNSSSNNLSLCFANLSVQKSSGGGINSPHKTIPEEQDESTVTKTTSESRTKAASNLKRSKTLALQPSLFFSSPEKHEDRRTRRSSRGTTAEVLSDSQKSLDDPKSSKSHTKSPIMTTIIEKGETSISDIEDNPPISVTESKQQKRKETTEDRSKDPESLPDSCDSVSPCSIDKDKSLQTRSPGKPVLMGKRLSVSISKERILDPQNQTSESSCEKTTNRNILERCKSMKPVPKENNISGDSEVNTEKRRNKENEKNSPSSHSENESTGFNTENQSVTSLQKPLSPSSNSSSSSPSLVPIRRSSRLRNRLSIHSYFSRKDSRITNSSSALSDNEQESDQDEKNTPSTPKKLRRSSRTGCTPRKTPYELRE